MKAGQGRAGTRYRLDKLFRVPQAHREIGIELLEKPDMMHVSRTDDPTGIEPYWHQRFDAKPADGDWSAPTCDDVDAFKRRRMM